MPVAWANLCSFNKNIINHAKSNALKAQIARKKRDDLMAQAVAEGDEDEEDEISRSSDDGDSN